MWNRRVRTLGWLAIDTLLLAVTLAVAYQLAFEFNPSPEYVQQFRSVLAPVVVIQVLALWVTGLHRRMTRYAGAGDLVLIAGALTAALVVGLAYFFILRSLDRTPANVDLIPWQWPIPRSVLVINWLAGMGATGGARLAWLLSRSWALDHAVDSRRALIIGATDVGDFAVRMLKRNPDVGLRPVAFLDEGGALTGRTIQGLPIVGALHDLGAVLADLNIDEALIALPASETDVINRVVEECRRHRVAVRVLPHENELIAGQRTFGSLRAVDAAEVLGREQADLHIEEAMNYIRGEVVLITGAGGSIGSEIARQVAPLGPARMILIGRGENSLFELAASLGPETPDRRYVVANVSDEARMRHLFAAHRPGVIFHAAAHKHVPLMETAPDEAVKNNILATDLLARLAHEHGAKCLVQISTDKAVRPSSVMGASKRIAERVVRAWAAQSDTKFVSVRFGNVLGSRGSVVPLFRRQIEHGGPVTVTDAAAERYFMTIPEATSLVLRAGAVAESGQLCVLDMGEPVLIDDLARNMITLSGLEPGHDIEITYTGLRPGEKLKEEYLSAQEGLQKTAVGKVWVTTPEALDPEALRRDLDALRDAAERCDADAIRRLLAERIPDMRVPTAGERI